MISAVTVKVSAAHPNAPLGPFYVIMGSAISLTIVDVPRSLGKREITGVVVKAKNADGEERGIAAERVGSAWGATVPDDFFDRIGTISNGITVNAVGKDETGAEETWVLGSGQLIVLDDTGVITPEEKRYVVKWYTSQPANPVNGDACSIDGVPCIYTRGQWRPFGVVNLDDTVTKSSVNGVKSSGIWTWVKSLLPSWLTPSREEPPTKDSVIGKRPVKPLPKYLHALSFDDAYPADAEAWYESLAPDAVGGACSAVRRGGSLYRNYDWTFDSAAEFVVKMSAAGGRHASVGVAALGAALTEDEVASGVYTAKFRALPGMTLDGINDAGVVAEINVDGGPKSGWHGTGANALHILAAVRWVLDHGETAQQAAEYIAENVKAPTGDMNFHFMIADATKTYIVENGVAHDVTDGEKVLTNYALYDDAHAGGGKERYQLLADGADISAVLWTKAYAEGNTWHSDFENEAQHLSAIEQWAAQGADKEAHRGRTTTGGSPWWQTVHTSVYDFTAKTLKVAVQESDEFFTFAAGQKPEVAWDEVKDKPPSFPPSAHASEHSTGGSDAITPSSIGAQPALSSEQIDNIAAVPGKVERGAFSTNYSETQSYSVGEFVFYEGMIYQCTTATAEGGEAWNPAHWAERKLHDFFKESNSLLGATIEAKIANLLANIDPDTASVYDLIKALKGE